MKKLFAALLALLLLTGCQGKKPQAEITPPEPQPVASEQAPEPPMPETAQTEQERQTLEQRLFFATVCTCMMEDSARWHLQALGIEADAPPADFSAAMEAFRKTLFAKDAQDTFWLIDETENGMELQFWRYDDGNHPGRLSCVEALFWEPGMETATIIGKSLVLDQLRWASCAADAPEEERARIEQAYERHSPNHFSGTGWRASLAPDGKLALMALDPERGGALLYPCSQTDGALIWNREDVPQGVNDELYRALCSVDFDESVIAAGERNLLRGLLASSLWTDDFIPWDGPRPVNTFDGIYLAYDLKNALRPLLNELRADESRAKDFLASGSWTLFHDGGARFHLTNDEEWKIELSAPLP